MTAVPTTELPETDAGILAAVEDNLAASRQLGAQRLGLAYAWATAHEAPLGSTSAGYRELGATRLPVDEYAPAELAVSLHTSPLAAQQLMADAIDLVHRLPRTLAVVQAGRLEAWVARKITALTRELSDPGARWVDDELADCIATLPTGRLLSLAEAKVTAADPALADAKAEQQRRRHTLHLGRERENGSRTLFARCDAADALRLFTLADQLARALQGTASSADDAGNETLDMLRARALGILANPALALSVLAGDHSDREEDAGPGRPGAALTPVQLIRAARAGRARTTLYVHLTPAMLATGEPGAASAPTLVARAEAIGALTRQMLLRLLGHEHITLKTLKPVINLAEHLTSDRYEVPAPIREHVHLAKPHDVFPHASCLSRHQDHDHVTPYAAAGAPAGGPQTHLGNLAKMVRRHHRIKTHAHGWRTWQLDEHIHLWRTPHGRYRLVDQSGTHPVEVEAIGTGPPQPAGPAWRPVIELWHTPTTLEYAA